MTTEAKQYVDQLIAEVDARTQTEASRYVDDLLAASFVPMAHTDHTAEFDSAVATLTASGIPRDAAVELMNRAVTRNEPLAKWAAHLARVRTKGVKVWGQ